MPWITSSSGLRAWVGIVKDTGMVLYDPNAQVAGDEYVELWKCADGCTGRFRLAVVRTRIEGGQWLSQHNLAHPPFDLFLKAYGDFKKYASDDQRNRWITSAGEVALLHFTTLVNLPSILEHGIVPRNRLTRFAPRATFNDQHRLDNCLDHSCFSVSFPNYAMFYKYRSQPPKQRWCVIECDFRTLEEYECIFCVHNAASTGVVKDSVAAGHSPSALQRLFADLRNVRRSDLQIPKSYTTDPQAEVLVRGQISPGMIRKIHVETPHEQHEIQRLVEFTPIEVVCTRQYFEPRCDWKSWPSRHPHTQVSNVNG